IQVAQKKVKKAFENAVSSSRVELIPSKIKMAIDTNVTALVNVTGALVEPPKEGQPFNAQSVQAWKHSYFLCHEYALNGLVDSLYNVYCKTTIAKELCESLERTYKTKDVGTKKFVVACFLDYKMVDSKNEMSVEDLVVRLRIEEENKLAQKNTYTHDTAKTNMVEHVRSSSKSNSKEKGKGKGNNDKKMTSEKELKLTNVLYVPEISKNLVSDEAIDKFVLYKTEVENQLGRKIKVVRSDRGGKYVSLFTELYAKHGIRHEFTSPNSPHQNGGENNSFNMGRMLDHHEGEKETRSSSRLDNEGVQDKGLRDDNEPTSYREADTSIRYVILCLYVDDVLIIGNNDKMIKSTKDMLKLKFDMKDMGLTDVILGIKIIQTQNGLVLSQLHYVDTILNNHNAKDSSRAKTPIDTSTQPDLAYAVSRLSRYTSNPSNADWKAMTGDFRSTSGYVFKLGRAALSWKSSKQTVIAKSTMKSEFIALDKYKEEAKWIR
nr:hypothetical protein [Tanacetum cinerariifolium]